MKTQKKFSLKNNRLAKTIIISGTVLIVVAFIILRYEGFIGLFKGGFTSGSAGLCAALIFGYFANFVFSPKMKK